jgi:hypothetical protein
MAKNIHHQAGKTPHSKSSRSKQFVTKGIFRHRVNDLFEEYNVDTQEDRLDFIKSMENDILFQHKI